MLLKRIFMKKTVSMYFFQEKFWRALMFWNVFFKGAIILRVYGCWLVSAALYFLSKFSPQVKAFSVLMCINTSLEL